MVRRDFAVLGALQASDIEIFKQRHGEQLSRFRRAIELELTRLADISDDYLRERQLSLFKEEMQEEIEDIKNKMKESRWPQIVFGRLCALLAPIPVVGTAPSILNAIYTAFGSGAEANTNAPLAYAAYAQRELFH